MIKFILTDIEGTTTKIPFVHEVLFPYFLEHLNDLDDLTQSTERDDAYRQISEQLKEEQNIKNPEINDIKLALRQYVKEDRKLPALKKLQGLIWKLGYQNGSLKAHLYPDVYPQLTNWKKQGLRLGVYSSGSVEAQHLLFEHSVEGNIKHLFEAFYDTAVGHKRDALAYANIQKDLLLKAEEILFLSDIEEELMAAKSVGFCVMQLCRDQIPAQHTFPVAKDFNMVNTFIQTHYGL